MNLMSKIVALTGNKCAGKSTALYCFGKLGARFLHQDYLQHLLPPIDIKIIIKQQLDSYKKANPIVPLIAEVHLDIVKSFPEWFDQIVIIESELDFRIKRLQTRNPEDALVDANFTIIPTYVITNNGTKEELADKISSLWYQELL